jgi:oligosaccharide repeat unit polymerase
VYLSFPKRAASIQHWLARPIQTAPSARRLNIILLAVCFLLLFGYVQQIGTLPIQQVFLGGSTTLELAQAREDSLKLITGRIVYVYALLRSVLFPYAAMLSVIIASTTLRPIWLVIAALSIFGNVVMASATLEKSPLAASFIMLCFTWLLLRRKPLSPKRLLLIAFVALAFPALILLAIYQFDMPFISLIDALWDRLFIVPADVLYFHFEYFPSAHSFLWGRTLPFLSKLMPGGPFALTNELCLYIIPDTTILSCSANAAYPAALWADFGWIGILLGSFIVGGVIQGLQFLTQALPKSGPSVVLQAFLSFQVIFLTSAALPDVIFANGMGYATALTIVILLMQRRSKEFSRPLDFKP